MPRAQVYKGSIRSTGKILLDELVSFFPLSAIPLWMVATQTHMEVWYDNSEKAIGATPPGAHSAYAPA